jgi:DNA-binding CsgD family transcriptional regulator
MLTRQEKEQKVLDLYNEGKTIREIAKELRMSFRDIGAILKKASGALEERQDIKESLSLSNKAYRLFSKGKTPIQVAITLNLSEDETTKFYQEYWSLKQLALLLLAYSSYWGHVFESPSFYELYDFCNLLYCYHFSVKEGTKTEHTCNNFSKELLEHRQEGIVMLSKQDRIPLSCLILLK